LLGCIGSVALLLSAGCDDDTGTGEVDMATTPDLAAPQGDMATAGGDMGGGADMATTPADMTFVATPTGTLLLMNVTGYIQVPVSDMGLQPVQVNALAPYVLLGKTSTTPADFDDRGGGITGCVANYYDYTMGDVPAPDYDTATLTYKGYTGGTLITGTPAPSEINCAPEMVAGKPYYKCGYGPVTDGGVGPDPTSAFFPGAGTAMKPGDRITVTAPGGGQSMEFGDISCNATPNDTGVGAVPTAVTIDATTPLQSVKYSSSADTSIKFACPTAGACGQLVLTQIILASAAPGAGFPGSKYATISCTGTFAQNPIVIPKDAIKAALNNGAFTPVATYTRVVGGGLATSAGCTKDSKNNPLTIAVGAGAFAFGTP
jgi:hypothetical protein